MAADSQKETGQQALILEYQGSLSRSDIETILSQIRFDGGLTRFKIELEADHLIYTPLAPAETKSTDATQSGSPSEESSEMTDTSANEESEHGIPTLRAESDPFAVAQTLADRADWMTSSQLKDDLAESEVNLDNLGSVLWHLAERELVEKRPFQDDKRKSEYHITNLGEQAVQAAAQRATTEEDASPSGANA